MTLNYHPTVGAWLDDVAWVPMPRYLLRRDRILRAIRDLPRGRLLEVGCGAGGLMYDFLRMGYEGHAVEHSVEAREIAAQFGEAFEFAPRDDFCPDWQGTVDVLVSMEVLEHIEDDVTALEEWAGYVKPGGYLLLGVPCQMSKWGASDVWAGHFRRYEKAEIIDKLAAQGFEVLKLETYGFPLANVSSFARNILYQRRLNREGEMTTAERTARSGVDRKEGLGLFPILRSPLGRLGLKLGYFLQARFLDTKLGDGFLIVARKVR